MAFMLMACLNLQAQNGVGTYRNSLQKIVNGFAYEFEYATVRIQFCTPGMVRVRTSWTGEFEPPEPYMVTNYDWSEIPIKERETDELFELSTDQIKVEISKAPFAMRIVDVDGKVLSTGIQHLTADHRVISKKALFPDEHFFGFGERMDFLDQRGKKVKLNVGRGEQRPHLIGAYNVLEANYSPVPFFMSTRGYGIFLHNSYASEWDLGVSDRGTCRFSADGGELDYYFIYGPEFSSILDLYTALTGKSPLMNRFAFGLHVGTYSGGTWGHEDKTSTQYVVALAKKFRELGIPIDILHLDSTWRIFGEHGGKGATTFEWRETFDHPVAMFDSLYQLDLNMVGVHLRPRFDNGQSLRLLDKARKNGYVYPESNSPGEFVNFFDEEAVDWWWENGVMRVANQGAMFLKTDEGSAFGRKANESDKLGPTGKEIQKLHNVFPIAYAKAPYEKFQEHNQLRGMNHTREGFAGIQRYPFIFAGDWPSEWQYFEPVVKAGLNIGLSGVGYWAHCMGGFEHDADPELYIRWCQFGLLSPVAHLFGMDHPGYKEPWNYGEEALRIFKQYDLWRYRLIPYMYTQGWEMYQTGMPIMRALVLENQEDVNTYNLTDQYLLGSDILLCPVVTKGAQTRSLYLPEGQWYSHWDGKLYDGQQYVHVVTPLDQMPVFYKAGAIIPTQPDVQYIGESLPDKLTLDIFPGPDHSFTMYEDDGRTLAYQSGAYALTTFGYQRQGAAHVVTLQAAEGTFDLPHRTYQLKIHSHERPSTVTMKKGGNSPEDLTVNFDEEAGIILVEVKKAGKEQVVIEVR